MKVFPEEIKSALNQPYGFILLIKGKAGTGKTTLALEILNNVKNPIYVSTRITPKLLYTQFPWIKETLSNENIIDATAFDFSHPTLLTESSIFEALQLHTLPDFVKTIFSKMTSPSGTLIIDSWDAIATLGETKWGQSQKIIANYLIELIREKNYNLILVVETEKSSFLDYIVDGIVQLKETLIEGNKRIRQLVLMKLRGICINQPSYLFTLYKGRFSTFMPIQEIPFESLKKNPIIKDKNSKISTGIPDFDKLLTGGLQKGQVILFEIQPYLEYAYFIITLKLALNFIFQKRGVVGLPSPQRISANDLNILRNILGNQAELIENVRIIEFGKQRSSLPPNILRILPKSNEEYFKYIKTVVKDLETIANTPIINFLNFDAVVFEFSMDEIRQNTPLIISQIKRSGNILIISAKKEDPYIQELGKVVDDHFVMDQIDRKVILYGKNPETNIFALNFDIINGVLQVKFIPIV